MPTLAEGLRQATDDFGRDYLLTPWIAGYLSDLRCWSSEGVRTVFCEVMRRDGAEVLAQHFDSAPDERTNAIDCLTVRLSKAGFSAALVRYVLESFAYGFRWRASEPIVPDEAGGQDIDHAQQMFNARGVEFAMVRVPGGRFTMGATPEHARKASYDERPPVSVELSSYMLAAAPVTQRLWQSVMGTNPSFFSGEDLPVERVTWNECQELISKLSTITGQAFRLPTEAEWEYAARGGHLTRGYAWSGGTSNLVDVYCWYKSNSGNSTHPVAMLSPNELGLYDMSGNVREWCQDWYFGSYIAPGADPQGPDSGLARVVRGGSWYDALNDCRVAKRFSLNPDYRSRQVGLRLAMSITQ